jgi:nitrogen regulatory protein P-II 1
MKEIKAIIQPFKLAQLRSAFYQINGFPGMSISRVDGCSRWPDGGNPKSIKEELTDFSNKTRIEIVADDELVDRIVDVLAYVAHTGQTGDGLVWVTPVETRVRICNGEISRGPEQNGGS